MQQSCELPHLFLESADMHRMSFVFSERVCNQDKQRLVNPIHVRNYKIHAQHESY